MSPDCVQIVSIGRALPGEPPTLTVRLGAQRGLLALCLVAAQVTVDGLTGACDSAASTMDGTAIPAAIASSRTFQLYLALTKDGIILLDIDTGPRSPRVTVSRSPHRAHLIRFALTAISTPSQAVTQVL